MTKKKRKPRVNREAGVNGHEQVSVDELNEGDESVHTLYEWRRLRGLKNRLSAALHRLDREVNDGPRAFEHFIEKCRDIVGREAE